jgi:hypothetical protein
MWISLNNLYMISNHTVQTHSFNSWLNTPENSLKANTFMAVQWFAVLDGAFELNTEEI